MRLLPFIGVDGTPFTVTRGDVLALRGTPVRTGRNAAALNELDYGDVIYRFQDSGRLEEITRKADVVHLGPVAVPRQALTAFITRQDGGAFAVAGFLVSPAFGLAFDPADPHWITALARHAIRPWRTLQRNSATPPLA
jgi:hypothetical protein